MNIKFPEMSKTTEELIQASCDELKLSPASRTLIESMTKAIFSEGIIKGFKHQAELIKGVVDNKELHSLLDLTIDTIDELLKENDKKAEAVLIKQATKKSN